MRRMIYCRIICAALFSTVATFAYSQKSTISFVASMDQPAMHTFHVTMNCTGFKTDSLDLKMPVWTPGYYQRLDFGNNVLNFQVSDGLSKSLGWRKMPPSTWRVRNNSKLKIDYDIKAPRPFVATPYLDEERLYFARRNFLFSHR